MSAAACFPKILTSLQSVFAADAHLAEGQLFKDELSWITEKFMWYRVRSNDNDDNNNNS